jgi:hypothetical protein
MESPIGVPHLRKCNNLCPCLDGKRPESSKETISGGSRQTVTTYSILSIRGYVS